MKSPPNSRKTLMGSSLFGVSLSGGQGVDKVEERMPKNVRSFRRRGSGAEAVLNSCQTYFRGGGFSTLIL